VDLGMMSANLKGERETDLQICAIGNESHCVLLACSERWRVWQGYGYSIPKGFEGAQGLYPVSVSYFNAPTSHEYHVIMAAS